MLLPALEAELVLDGCGRHWSGGITIPPTLLARRMSPVVAHFVLGHCVSRCPLMGANQTSQLQAPTSEIDPERTSYFCPAPLDINPPVEVKAALGRLFLSL